MTKLKKGILAAAMALCLFALILGGIFLQKAKISYAEEVLDIDGENYGIYLDITEDGDSVVLNGFKTGVTLPSRIKLVIPDNVTEIKASAFAGKGEIISVTLPESLETIGNRAFENCTGLVEVCNKSAAIDLSEEGTTSTAYGNIVYYALNVYTPDSGESKLDETDDGYLFCVDTRTDPANPLPYLLGTTSDATELTLPADYNGKAYAIFQYAFWNYSNLTSVEAGDANITAIGNFAFYQCTSLGSITLPDTVTQIDYSAFTRCTSLTTISLPANLETIALYAFSECTALSGSITIPAAVKEIGNNAFYGCSALQEVIFEDGETDLDIGQQSFRGCAELTVVTLPARLNSINRLVFADCAKLGFAYMPAGVTYNGISVLENSYFGTNTAIIFENYAAYKEASEKKYIGEEHASQLTYIVGIEFNGGGENGEGGTFSRERLAGRAFDYVKSPGGSWAVATESDMENLFPAQNGYLTSVWYSDAACEKTVTADDINAMLAIDEHNDGITLYAIYKAKPELNLKSVTYNETSSYGWQDFIEGTPGEGYTVQLSGEGLVGGKAVNAGDYILTVNLDEQYGVWSEAPAYTVTVNRKAVNLSTLAEWSGLEDGTIYVYRNGEGNEIYSGAQLSAGNIPEGYTYYRTLTVVNSVAKYTGNEITVAINQNTAYTIGNYVQNSGTDEGKYTAQVTLTASGNYRLTASAPVNTESGYTITISENQDSATVEKEWYIIKSGNLLYAAGGTDAYSISGWTYNSDVTRVAPVLQHPANIINKPFTFTLALAVSETTTTTIGTSIAIGEFGDYINSSMPAGNYIITFNIPDVNGDDGNVEFFSRSEHYSFTVEKADIKQEWISDIKAALTDRTEILSSTAKLYNKNNTSLAIWNDPINNRKGIWQNETYNNYYSEEFALTYNLYRMQSNEYVPYTDVVRDWLTAPDTYTVYYQFTAENYNPLVDTADDSRREYSFEVILYDVVTIPEISSLDYTGSKLTPVVAANPLYTAEYSTAGYVNAGTHSVTLTLADNIHYKWIKGGEEQTGAAVQVQFEINRANNRVNVNLSIAQWTYGDYNEEVNVPSWGVVFFDGDDANFYSYILTQKDGEEVYTQDKFGQAPIGWYILTATAKGYIEGDETTAHYNWNAFTDNTYEIYISKGINTWSVTPNVMQWNYRNYDREVNLILAQAKIGDGKEVNFKVTSDVAGNTVIEGLENFTAANGVVAKEIGDILAGLNVGSYYLWASVDSTEDYEGIDPVAFQFKVSVAENVWKTAPEIKSWIVGKYDAEENKVLFESQFEGEESIVITVAGNEDEVIYDSVNGIDNLKDAKVGVYELKVTVKGTSDFNDLTYTFVFNVFDKEGMPWWATLLIVVGALGLAALVLFILHQKGVLQMLTGKVIIAMRTRAAIDATIAAVRASKVAARAKVTVAAAEAKDAAEARKKAQAEAKTDENQNKE